MEAKSLAAQQTAKANANAWAKMQGEATAVLDRLEAKIVKAEGGAAGGEKGLSPERIAGLRMQLQLLNKDLLSEVQSLKSGGRNLLLSENMNLKCDDADSTHEHEFKADNLEGCAKKCMDSPWCGYYSYWPATAWCKLTSVCATKTPDSHFEYKISIYAKDAKRAKLAAVAAPAAALAAAVLPTAAGASTATAAAAFTPGQTTKGCPMMPPSKLPLKMAGMVGGRTGNAMFAYASLRGISAYYNTDPGGLQKDTPVCGMD
jgi:hypothetical protein